ncbi:DUF4168 domain-containing protein [Leptolyngbya sp. PCC 6406]|uniref:DUF4168 domain-containing protein n=1 Tax=Leptolyngbya sp. PCC 6406 TaxID=1173264 RepID=UPI0002ACF20B|nr:DUF4168 domain-containing protein [Leptolyngbya sp. PCC 6406]
MLDRFLGLGALGWGWFASWEMGFWVTVGKAVVWGWQWFWSVVAGLGWTVQGGWRPLLRGGLVGILVGSLVFGLGMAPAGADSESESVLPEPLASEVNSSDIPSEKVTQFVSAYMQVVNLIDSRSEELERAQTEAESLRLQQAIQTAAYDLIEETGLTRLDYWQLLGLANTDTEFRDRVLAQLEERDR